MNKKISIGLLTCVIAGQPLAIASEDFEPEAEMVKLLGHFVDKASVMTDPPRNKVIYDPTQRLNTRFMKAIQAQVLFGIEV